MRETLACDMRFARNFIGGPLAGCVVMVRPGVRSILASDRGIWFGTYVLTNIGWIYVAAEAQRWAASTPTDHPPEENQ